MKRMKEKEKMTEQKNRANKPLNILKNIIIIFVLIGGGYTVLLVKSIGINHGEEIETKLKVCAISQNDSIAKGFELKKHIAIEIISKLDSILFNSYNIATVKMFDNEYLVHRINEDYFCAIYNNQDTIMLDKLNDTRMFVMNRLYVDTRTDELNELIED